MGCESSRSKGCRSLGTPAQIRTCASTHTAPTSDAWRQSAAQDRGILCRLPHISHSLRHACPALCRARARSSDVLLGLHRFPPSSAEDDSPLFIRFTGTPVQSDPSRPCMAAAPHAAFAARPRSKVLRGGLEVSRFSGVLLLGVQRFSDYAGPTGHSRLMRPVMLPSPSEDGVGTLAALFGAPSPRPPMPLSPLHASSRDATCKTQGQDGVAHSFPAGVLHHLQHASLSRRTPRLLGTL